MRKAPSLLSVRRDPTLGSLAEAVLPPVAKRAAGTKRRSRQRRFRDHVREKRHR